MQCCELLYVFSCIYRGTFKPHSQRKRQITDWNYGDRQELNLLSGQLNL